jgi:hypothetical protein
MRLKEFFSALANNGHKVEIYYTQENLDPEFGFIIYGIDSRFCDSEDEALANLVDSVCEDIMNQFLNADLHERFEGATSYLLLSEGRALRSAEYFDWTSAGDQIWLANHEHKFIFDTEIVGIDELLLQKDRDGLQVYKSDQLEAQISNDLFKAFLEFYSNVLVEFQMIDADLVLSQNDSGQTESEIVKLTGSYSLEVDFTLMDSSEFELEKAEAIRLLRDCFDFEPDELGFLN